jgi:hypothetical protein
LILTSLSTMLRATLSFWDSSQLYNALSLAEDCFFSVRCFLPFALQGRLTKL